MGIWSLAEMPAPEAERELNKLAVSSYADVAKAALARRARLLGNGPSVQKPKRAKSPWELRTAHSERDGVSQDVAVELGLLGTDVVERLGPLESVGVAHFPVGGDAAQALGIDIQHEILHVLVVGGRVVVAQDGEALALGGQFLPQARTALAARSLRDDGDVRRNLPVNM